jgi:hypothetical protein
VCVCVCARTCLEGGIFLDQRVSFGAVLSSSSSPTPTPDLFEKDSDLFSHTQTDLIVEE